MRPGLKMLVYGAPISVCLLAGNAAYAASIVLDGGFESAGGGNAYYSGSSIDGGSWKVTAGVVYIENLDPYVDMGNNSADLTAFNPYLANTLSQTLSTVVGQTYLVSFYGDADSANAFSLTDNGLSVSGVPSMLAATGFSTNLNATNSAVDFSLYTGSFRANSTSTVLSFTDTSNPAVGTAQTGSVVIDGVSVTAVPEPSALVLAGTGLAGLAGLVRRRVRR